MRHRTRLTFAAMAPAPNGAGINIIYTVYIVYIVYQYDSFELRKAEFSARRRCERRGCGRPGVDAALVLSAPPPSPGPR